MTLTVLCQQHATPDVALSRCHLPGPDCRHALEDSRQARSRNGNLPGRTVQIGISYVTVKMTKVRGWSGGQACFNSALLSPNLKRGPSVEELLTRQ